MKLHCKTLGEGRPLLILHGLLGSGDNWAAIARALSAYGFAVTTIDQRNHGRSPHDASMDYRCMAEDLQELIVANSWENPVLLGHSMGGKTAMFHLQLFPGIAEKLIVADIAPRYYPPHHAAVFSALHAADLTVLTSRKAVEDALRSKLTEETVVQFLLKNLYWNEQEKLAWRFNLPVIESHIEDISAALPNTPVVHQPVLFLRGEHSGYIRASDIPVIRQLFPNAEVETVSGAGH